MAAKLMRKIYVIYSMVEHERSARYGIGAMTTTILNIRAFGFVDMDLRACRSNADNCNVQSRTKGKRYIRVREMSSIFENK